MQVLKGDYYMTECLLTRCKIIEQYWCTSGTKGGEDTWTGNLLMGVELGREVHK